MLAGERPWKLESDKTKTGVNAVGTVATATGTTAVPCSRTVLALRDKTCPSAGLEGQNLSLNATGVIAVSGSGKDTKKVSFGAEEVRQVKLIGHLNTREHCSSYMSLEERKARHPERVHINELVKAGLAFPQTDS